MAFCEVKWPSVEQLPVAAFERKTGFPRVIGCVDGNVGAIRGPSNNRDAYISRKSHASFQLQAVCDSQLIFTNIYTGNAGSVHDARVYRTSDLKSQLETNPSPSALGFCILPERGLNCPIQKMNKSISTRSTVQHVDTFRGRLGYPSGGDCYTWTCAFLTMYHGIASACVLQNLALIMKG